MSYQTGAVLDAPDQELQAIQLKLWRGQPLTRAESARWANRIAVERETVRTGGRVAQSVVPQTAGTEPQLSPEQAGWRDAQQASGYIRGRDRFLSQDGQPRGVAGQVPGQRQVRRSAISNSATDEEKEADNRMGPHENSDGLPGYWNQPKMVAGRYNGGSMDEGAGLPAGTIAMQGADGAWKAWSGGSFGQDRFGSLADVGAGRRITTSAETPAGPPLNPPPPLQPQATPAPVAARPATSLEEDEAYIRGAGFGDFVDRARAGDQAPGTFANPRRVTPEMAGQAWMGMGGQLARGNAQRPAAPVIDVSATRQPAPIIDTMGAERQPAPFQMATLEPGYERPSRGFFSGPGTSVPSGTRGLGASQPMFPNAIWNTPAPRQYQATAERFNPFEEERRRRISVLPE